MLILNRRVNQAIKIGEEIKITVIRNDDANVVLGVDAPKEMLIIRTELCSKNRAYFMAKREKC